MAFLCKIRFHSLILILSLLQSTTAVFWSFNQPKFCPNALWNTNGTLFANASLNPHAIFVHVDNNTVYVTEQDTNRARVWSSDGTTLLRTISNNLNNPGAIFVTIDGDIYIDSGNNNRVELWTWNATIGANVMNVSAQCMGLFIDMNNTLYCSASNNHQVVGKSLNGNENPTRIIIGTGVAGSGSNQLCDPNGLFVDVNFNLYVADWCNNRIQKFAPRQITGVTVAGATATNTVSLNGPTAVILDGNGYLFIADSWNNRIVASGPNGFRCLLGCSGISGIALNQFNKPRDLGFDSYGNMIITDRLNGRILKFTLATNSCDPFSTSQSTSTTSRTSQPILTTTRTSPPMSTTTISTKISTSTVQTTAISTSALTTKQHLSSSSTSTKLSTLYLYMLLCIIVVA